MLFELFSCLHCLYEEGIVVQVDKLLFCVSDVIPEFAALQSTQQFVAALELKMC